MQAVTQQVRDGVRGQDLELYSLSEEFFLVNHGSISIIILIKFAFFSLSIGGFLLVLLILSGGSAIGGGDVKLMAGSGLFLGLKLNILAFLLGCIIGSFIHIIRMKFFNAGRELAMGPYLAVGIMLAFLFGNSIIDWYFGLFIL